MRIRTLLTFVAMMCTTLSLATTASRAQTTTWTYSGGSLDVEITLIITQTSAGYKVTGNLVVHSRTGGVIANCPVLGTYYPKPPNASYIKARAECSPKARWAVDAVLAPGKNNEFNVTCPLLWFLHSSTEIVATGVHPAPGAAQQAQQPTQSGGSLNARWTGMYSDGPHVYRITGSGNTVTGSGAWTAPGQTFAQQGATTEFGQCAASGSTARCPKASGKYWDSDKTITWGGTCTLTLSGDTLSTSCSIASTAPVWTQGVTPYPDSVAVHAGATFTDTNKRVAQP